MKIENISGLILVFGAALIVTAIIFIDIYKKKAVVKPFLKWLTVFILSVWQVGCWRALNGFGTAFGNNSNMAAYEILFIAIVSTWFVFQIVSYLKNKNKISDS
ncbi:MAG: hypothetical protein GY694_14275 [Gammaproteobacteria bacterium]|nr:hypothetical protein [Gammaproteobacteria bacterium]